MLKKISYLANAIYNSLKPLVVLWNLHYRIVGSIAGKCWGALNTYLRCLPLPPKHYPCVLLPSEFGLKEPACPSDAFRCNSPMGELRIRNIFAEAKH